MSQLKRVTSYVQYLAQIKLMGNNFLRPHFCKEDLNKEQELNNLISLFLQQALEDICSNYYTLWGKAKIVESDYTYFHSATEEEEYSSLEEYEVIEFTIPSDIKFRRLRHLSIVHPDKGILNSCEHFNVSCLNTYQPDTYYIKFDEPVTEDTLLDSIAIWVGIPVSVGERNTYIPEFILEATYPYVLDKLYNHILRSTGHSTSAKASSANSFKQEYTEIVQRLFAQYSGHLDVTQLALDKGYSKSDIYRENWCKI